MNPENKIDERPNVLRAGVLGANDGITSVAGVVIGVAASTSNLAIILLAGASAALAGAFSMAGGEYVSVSTQADTEKMLAKENGTSMEALKATNPWHAAISSFISFAVGSILPLLAIWLVPKNFRIIATVIAVAIALFLTGYISAALGGAPKRPSVIRNVIVGLLTMLVTYIIGTLIHI